MRHILGFNSAVYTAAYHESENVVNIMNINSILVNIGIITGSYVNGRMQPVIYSFFPNVSPGYKIVEKPPHLKYLPVTLDTVANLRTYITDQDGNLLNLYHRCVKVVTIVDDVLARFTMVLGSVGITLLFTAAVTSPVIIAIE